MIDLKEIYDNDDFKKVCMNFKEFPQDDVLRVVISLGIVASRNNLFINLMKDELNKVKRT